MYKKPLNLDISGTGDFRKKIIGKNDENTSYVCLVK